MTLKPRAWVFSSTLLGGGAPAVITCTVCFGTNFISSGALASIASTMGAAPKWVTPWSRMALKMFSGVTARLHTRVPPMRHMVHTWPQPLQWNIGTVYR